MGRKKKERVKKTSTKKLKEKRVKKRKMVKARRKRKEMIKNLFNFCCHQTSSFRTTYTKYATSSSSLLSKKKSRENVGCSFCIERFHGKNKEKTKNANRKRSGCEKKIIDEREKNPNLRKTARNARPILYDSEHQL